MKVFKYLIYVLIAIILVCLIVLIFQPERSQALRPNSILNLIDEQTQPSVEELTDELIANNKTKLVDTRYFLKTLPKDAVEIDSNGNGIRDDIEVYIGHKFPEAPIKRASYIQMFNVIDTIAKERGRGRISKQYSIYLEEKNAIECWFSNGFDATELDGFKKMILNNSYRIESYNETLKVRETLDRDIIDSMKMSESPCNLMLQENQMSLQQ
ncbi:hypothetical protein R3X26_00755 [Vibrio sp. TH_r3]|uniref:hypothetical protein n=1 Tax=Vibrio sp. TH_r3 TaxID=3082084 RepID=UPI002952A2D4|nr:hypothetical protein [Vibrio sp. TH_r3]MDV7102932.1 hypothetical protein [Vibrio sp. TH_r3]